MAVKLTLTIEHAEDGSLRATPEIHAKADSHCACEMAFAMTVAKSAMEFAPEFSPFITETVTKKMNGDRKNVH